MRNLKEIIPIIIQLTLEKHQYREEGQADVGVHVGKPEVVKNKAHS